jgi:chorismate mutase / prephenate dehydratase
MADEAAPQSLATPSLEEARAQLDAIDDQILDLVRRRTAHADQIAAAKGPNSGMPLRPAREVRLLRRLINERGGTDPDLIFELWRALIAANIRRQGAIEVVVASAGDIVRPFDLARRHFSGATKLTKAVDARDALVKALEQKNTVAVLPWPAGGGVGMWWPILSESRFHALSIISALPLNGPATAEPEAALVAANVALEPADNDKTFGLAFDPHYRSARALNEAQLKGREAARVRETVLIEMEGFVAKDDGRIGHAMRAGLEGLRVIGAYARI